MTIRQRMVTSNNVVHLATEAERPCASRMYKSISVTLSLLIYVTIHWNTAGTLLELRGHKLDQFVSSVSPYRSRTTAAQYLMLQYARLSLSGSIIENSEAVLKSDTFSGRHHRAGSDADMTDVSAVATVTAVTLHSIHTRQSPLFYR